MNEYSIIHNQRELSKFLEQERMKNLSLIKGRFSLSHEDAEDIYQDSCLALFKNIRDGKLSYLSSKLATYFTQICLNLSMKKTRDSKRVVSLEDGLYDINKVDELLGLTEETAFTERQVGMLHNILSCLPEPCDKILWNYYGEERSMADIAFIINYKDAATVKSKKWQCMKNLDQVITDKTRAEFYGNK